MKIRLLGIILFVTVGLYAQPSHFCVQVENRWNQAKTDAPIVVKIGQHDICSAKVTLNGKSIAYQLDDMNGDTQADELVFLVNIGPNETQEYDISLSNEQPTETFTPRVYADMMLDDKKSKHPLITSLEAPGESYLYNDVYHHGAAFESELTAYRIYFDQRQNIDLYGKKQYRLELAETHFYATEQHLQQGYGNDVLWAGNSVGCGSFKGYDGNAPQNIEPVKTRGQRIIAAGPLRTVVEVKDIGWNGMNMYQTYILYAGHRECEVRIHFDKPLNGQRFCTGVQKIGQTPEGFTRKDGIAASWGNDYPEMGQKELFPPETVGLAIYMPEKYIKEQKTDELNYLFIIGADGQKDINYYVTFCADKETEGFHNAQEWFNSLEQLKAMIDHPLLLRRGDDSLKGKIAN